MTLCPASPHPGTHILILQVMETCYKEAYPWGKEPSFGDTCCHLISSSWISRCLQGTTAWPQLSISPQAKGTPQPQLAAHLNATEFPGDFPGLSRLRPAPPGSGLSKSSQLGLGSL